MRRSKNDVIFDTIVEIIMFIFHNPVVVSVGV